MVGKYPTKFTAAGGLMLGLSISCLAFPAHQQANPASAPSSEVGGGLTVEQRADIFMARKEYDDAIDYYDRALRQAGMKRADLWNKMGIAYQQKSDFGHARKCYKESIHLDSNFAPAWNNLGTTYYLADNARKSVKYYKRAVRLKPDDASLHMNLGTAYYARKKFKLAVDQYHAALVLDPNVLSEHAEEGTIVEAREADAQYYFYLAKAFASLGRAGDAVRYLEHAMEDGYKNFHKIEADPDFQKIKNYPAYVELLKNPPVGIKD